MGASIPAGKFPHNPKSGGNVGATMKKKLTLAANNAETLLANAAEGGSPFAILQGDGFLVPFGKFPHKQGLQLFDKDAAEAIVAAHNGITAKLTRWVTGGSYPIYVGHPDLPGSKDADKRAYGWIENMRVTDEGLHLSAKWSEAGRELVENAHFKFYSPLWWTRKVKGGIQPIALKSMGLTNDPNIPVPALANEAEESGGGDQESGEESHTNEENMKPELLAALGLEEGATAEDALAKIVSLKEASEVAANAEKPEDGENSETLKAETLKAEEEKVAAEEKAKLAEEEKAAAEGKVATAAANVVDMAIAAGKITPAEKDAKVADLLAANDFAAALQDLGKLPAKVKTESVTGDLGNAKSRLVIAANDETAAAKAERATLVENEFQNTSPALSTGERKRIAWERARRKNPEAFGKEKSTGTAA